MDRGWWCIQDADNAFHDVVNVGEVAAEVAVVVHINRLTGQDLLSKLEERHVGAAPRAVDGEEAQAGYRQLVHAGIAVGHGFVGLLGGGIEAYRCIGGLCFAEGHLVGVAIYGRTTGEHQVLDRVLAAAFQDVEEALHIAVDVGVGVFNGVAHACLCRQVDDDVENFLCKELFQMMFIGDVELGKADAVLTLQEFVVFNAVGGNTLLPQSRQLEVHTVVGIEVVDAYHVMAILRQADSGVHTDEACGAGY